MNNRSLGVIFTLLSLFILITLAYFVNEANIAAPEVPIRYLAVLIGAVAVGVVYYLTRTSEVWDLPMQKVIYGVAGAAVYAVFVWLFSDTLFQAPAVSDLPLRPAAIFPALFGWLFGPLVGFMAGGFGNIGGDWLAGFKVSPEWDMGNALIGFVAGMHLLFDNKKRALDIATGVAAAVGVLSAIGYARNSSVTNPLGEGAISPWLGYSVVAGAALCVAFRFVFPGRNWGESVVWGAAGNLVGLGLAAISAIWINAGSLTPVEATLGQFLPTAGPNAIAIAALMPILVAGLEYLQEREGEAV